MTTTDAEWSAFLVGLATYGQVRAACMAANISAPTAYRRYKADPEFAEAWDHAKDKFGALIRMRVLEASKSDNKVLLALDRLANKDDYETTRNVKVQGQVMIVSAVPLSQRLHELPTLTDLPALDVPVRVLADEEDE